MKHDLLHIQGKPFVLVPLHEYRSLMTNEPQEIEAELPDDIKDRIFAGESPPIKILRHYRGLTQEELAEAAGLSRPYLTEIEQGRKNGSVNALKAIADALDVNISYIAA